MVSINTISVTIYSIILLVLHIFLPIKILERYIYGSEYISGDKIKVRDVFFKPYGFRDIESLIKTALITPFMLYFYVCSIVLMIIFNLRESNKLFPIYLLSYFTMIILYIIHLGIFMYTGTGGIFGNSMIKDTLERDGENKEKDKELLKYYRKTYSPKWILIILLIPIYITLYINGIKILKNEILTMSVMLIIILLLALL